MLNFICHSLSYFRKKCQSKWVFNKIFDLNPILTILLYRESNFLIFVMEHVIVSYKPNTGYVGTLFGINNVEEILN